MKQINPQLPHLPIRNVRNILSPRSCNVFSLHAQLRWPVLSADPTNPPDKSRAAAAECVRTASVDALGPQSAHRAQILAYRACLRRTGRSGL